MAAVRLRNTQARQPCLWVLPDAPSPLLGARTIADPSLDFGGVPGNGSPRDSDGNGERARRNKFVDG